VVFAAAWLVCAAGLWGQERQMAKVAIAIHGGAGTIDRSEMTPQREKEYRDKLEEIVRAAHKILADGGTSLDAVNLAVRMLEDSPLFNAGAGAVYTSAQTHECDAAIMEGKTLKAGSVASLKHVKNPIDLARMVMERTPHVMLIGEGAEAFAKEQGVQLVDQSYFDTEFRLMQFRKWQQKQRDKAAGKPTTAPSADEKHGTVGAVALDRFGNLAAASSTGGMTGKRPGRVGDTPIIGSGTYADNHTCATSMTGHGEFFMRLVVGHEIAALMKYGGKPLKEAADIVIHQELQNLGGEGGIICIDHDGNIAMPFNTNGMFRASIDVEGRVTVGIYR
jgi:beta-aspartyl-peptidase (threonine type)